MTFENLYVVHHGSHLKFQKFPPPPLFLKLQVTVITATTVRAKNNKEVKNNFY
jgi:hypothetical protein